MDYCNFLFWIMAFELTRAGMLRILLAVFQPGKKNKARRNHYGVNNSKTCHSFGRDCKRYGCLSVFMLLFLSRYWVCLLLRSW